MDTLRTPDARFSATRAAFPYSPTYVTVPVGDGDTVRMATYAAGPETGPVVVLLHGEPTWSYLYRHVMERLAVRGARAVAIDLVGFGRSDKPANVGDHSYAAHVAWTRAAMEALGLSDVTLVGQDWGGLIGLRIATEAGGLVAGFVAANTGLPTGDHPMPDIWWTFRRAIESAPVVEVGRFVASGCVRGLADVDRAAYDAPFPDESFKAGPRAMPGLVPTAADDPAADANRAAWARLATWHQPFLVAFSDGDPITGPMADVFRLTVPAAGREPSTVLRNAGHFLQEDAGPELGVAIADFLDRTATGSPG